MNKQITARAGDCVLSIADKHGLFWETVWDDPENAELKEKREDPMVLVKGDIVSVLDLRPREESIQTEGTHQFRRKGIPCKIRVRFSRNDEPRAYESFRAEVDGMTIEGKTDDDGILELYVSPKIKEITVILGEGKKTTTHTLQIGKLDPIEEISGVNSRLMNLGFLQEDCGEKWTEASRAGLRQFQTMVDLEPTGELDNETREALCEEHIS